MSRLTVDNRDMGEQEEYLMARIEALKRRVTELESELAKTKQPKVPVARMIYCADGAHDIDIPSRRAR